MRVLAVASAGVFMAVVDSTMVNTVFPDIRRSFPEASIGGLSWIFNAYNIVYMGFVVAAGRVADLLGRRRLFCAGMALFLLGSLLCAIAPSLELLVAARIVQAAGGATIVPASLAIVVDAFPADRRAHAVSLWSAVATFAAAAGPVLGGAFAALGGWRLAFLVNVPFGAVALVAAGRTLVESRAPGRRRMPDVAGALLLALAIGALTLGIVQARDWGWAGPGVIGLLVAALGLGALFVARSARHRAPLIDVDLLQIATLSLANVLTILASGALAAYMLCNVLYLTEVWGYSVLEAGLALTPGLLVATAVASRAGRLADRYGHRALLVPGGLVWVAGVLFLITQMGTRPAFVSEWLPAALLLGAGCAVAFSALSSVAVSSAPGDRFATAGSLNSVSRKIGTVLGVAIVVTIVGAPPPAPAEAAAALERGWIFCAILLLAVPVGSLWMGRVQVGEKKGAHEQERPSRRPAPRQRPPTVSAGAGAAARVGAFLSGASAPARESEADFLARVPLFAGLSDGLRARVAGRARTVRLAAGACLVRRGEPADTLYVVRSGQLEALHDEPGPGNGAGPRAGRDAARALGRGVVVGELAVVSSSRHHASIRAGRDSELLAIDRASIDSLLRDTPDFGLALVRVLGERIAGSREAAPQVRPVPATIALVPLEPGVAVTEVANRLADSLGRLGSVAMLDGSERSRDDPVSAYGPLLARCERDHDRTLLVADCPAEPDPWTRLCLAQADRVLALSGGGPLPAWVERSAALRGCDLVCCVGGEGSRDWAPWVDALAPAAHHRLAGGAAMAGDLERLARRLAGRSLGIVLSGGGARGLAHIGVLEELQRSGVEIDRVGGCSMGAYVGALLALGLDAAQIDARCYEEWVRRNPINDYTLSRTALLRGHKMEQMLERVFDPAVFEEAALDLYCVSADLRAQELVVHRHGRLADAVGASMCLPVLGAPRVRGRRLLVDGGVLNNLPAGIMKATGEGPVIAVDATFAWERPADLGGAGPTEATVPPLLETLDRMLMLGSVDTSAELRAHADLVIAPRVDGLGMLEFHQIDAAREAGRRATLRALERAPEGLFGSDPSSRHGALLPC